MENKIKMIGLDLDGTVFTNDKKITKRTIDAITKAINAGIIVLPATGRPLAGIPSEFLAIQGVSYALTANGARLHDLMTGRVIYNDAMNYETAAEVISILKEFDVMSDAFIDGVGYVERHGFDRYIKRVPEGPLKDYIIATRQMVENLREYILESRKESEKITIHFHKNQDGSLFKFKEVWEALKSVPGILVVSGAPTDLEITKEGVTKGTGLLALGKLLGIKREEIMACGDSGNDRDMLMEAGFGVAMKNSTEDVLEAADFITGSNEEDGVAYAIERFVLGE